MSEFYKHWNEYTSDLFFCEETFHTSARHNAHPEEFDSGDSGDSDDSDDNLAHREHHFQADQEVAGTADGEDDDPENRHFNDVADVVGDPEPLSIELAKRPGTHPSKL